MGVGTTLLSATKNPNKVIIHMGKGPNKYTKLTVYPGCCIGMFSRYSDPKRYVCSCGGTCVFAVDWSTWFYLTPGTVRILGAWIESWTGLENVEVDVKW